MAELSWERMGRCARLAWEHAVESHSQSGRRRPGLMTGHLLLGVISEPGCAGGLILRRLNVDLALADSILRFELLHGRVVPGHEDQILDLWDRPHTSEAFHTMELSLGEAERFSSSYPIGTEHILLAMLSVPIGMGCRTLGYFGVGYDDALSARDEIWALLRLTE